MRKVTHEMASEAYFKLHNHVYNRGPVPLLTIPRSESDVDVLLCDYIKQQKELQIAIEALYYSAYWASDRLSPEEEQKLWVAVRDAAQLPAGESLARIGPSKFV